MVLVITEISKYLMIILIAIYVFESFFVLSLKDPKKRRSVHFRQYGYIILLHLNAYMVMYLNTNDLRYIAYFFMQELLIFIIQIVYQLLYKDSSKLVTNNVCILLIIGFIILGRLNPDRALRHFFLALIAVVISSIIPFFIEKLSFLSKLTYVYAGIGVLALGAVALSQQVTYGAKISFTIGPVTLQPSEFIKIIFVFFIASSLSKSTKIKNIIITSVVAAIQVLILVVSRDLGCAVIFFVTYLIMLYVATKKPMYLGIGAALGGISGILAYKLFSHVKTRVIAWRDPLGNIDDKGYQISQSLFAIGMGSWFGTGLFQGNPKSIPVVTEDFVFSAVSEEMGGIFAICLILICACTFICFLNIALQIKNTFYKLIALGLGTCYGFQVFICIGGVIKFIPSTGVTLPLVSYGGSSLMSTFIMIAIIQGLYNRREKTSKKGGRDNEN